MVDRVAKSDETPSIRTRGSLPPVSDVVPRTRTLVSIAIRSCPFVTTFTPTACPERALIAEFTKPLFICFSPTFAIEPTIGRVSLMRNNGCFSCVVIALCLLCAFATFAEPTIKRQQTNEWVRKCCLAILGYNKYYLY